MLMEFYKKVILGLVVLLFGAVAVYSLSSVSYYNKMDRVWFHDLNKQELSAKYLKGTNGKGVIIVNDLSHDMSELSSMVNEFGKLGYSVYIFDFPSHGRSGGAISYRYKEKDELAEQFYCAMVSFSQMAQLSEQDIHIVAHGTGARAVLYTCTKEFLNTPDITLIGTDINMTEKIQLDVLNFAQDSKITWIQALNSTNPGMKIHLISGNLDDLSSVKNNQTLKKVLEKAPDSTTRKKTNQVTLTGINWVFHNYQMNSSRVIKSIVDYIAGQDGQTYVPSTFQLTVRPWTGLLLLGLIGLFNILFGYFHPKETGISEFVMPEGFLMKKLLIWLPALFVALCIPVVFYFLPVKFPYANIIPFAIFACYGITMFILYRYTNFAEDLGVFVFTMIKSKNFWAGLFTLVLGTLAVKIASMTGMFYIYPFKSKWIWMIVFTLLSSLIFFINEKEQKLVGDTAKNKILLMLINYLGILIAPILLMGLGMFSYAATFFTMVLGLALVSTFDAVLDVEESPSFFNAFVKAFLFQLIVFSRGALFI